MAIKRTIAGSGYGSAYVDALVWGGSVWDNTQDPDYVDPNGWHRISWSEGWSHQQSIFDGFVANHGGTGLITSIDQVGSWKEPGDPKLSLPSERWYVLSYVRKVFSDVSMISWHAGSLGSQLPGVTPAGIVFWNADLGPDLSGYSEVPSEQDVVWTYFNHTSPGADFVGFGGLGLQTMIHEVGHALGLAHPHDGGSQADGSKFPGVTGESDLGEHNLNQDVYTVMSYNHGHSTTPATLGYGNQGGLGAFDIAALQTIYGANPYTESGDSVYALPTQNVVGSPYSDLWAGKKPTGTGWMCIWDAGGTDTISGEASTAAVTIDLRAATLESGDPLAGGAISHQRSIAGGFTIANKVVIENAIGGSGDDSLTGNEANNRLVGNGGDDILWGKAGADTMIGGAGDDTYLVDSTRDVVTEDATGGSSDQVNTSISYTLPSYIEILIARDSDSIDLTGNDLDNDIFGDDGANKIDGGLGKDRLYGGAGSDTYHVDNAEDNVVEHPDDGEADLVYASVSHTLTDHVELLYAAGSSSIKLTGNELANTIVGNAGRNKINGGLGLDALTGGKGRDTFIFKGALSSANLDTITDFSVRDDTIQLENGIFKKLGKAGTLNNKFFKIGSKPADKNDYLIYNKKTGVLSYDADGSGKKFKAVAFLELANKAKLTVDDFLII